MNVGNIDHIEFYVGDSIAVAHWMRTAYGFRVYGQGDPDTGLPGQRSVLLGHGDIRVLLTSGLHDPRRQAGQIDDFLAWHGGAGVQHVAFLTDDIVRAVRTFTGRGVEFARTPASYYDLLAGRLGPTDIPVEALRPLGILVDRDHWGQMYQIFAKSTHIRRTYFLELIDRHGARTFGSSNIPALYEAKERELAEVRRTAGTVRV